MYNDYFGFREKPFHLTPDPRFFYENPVYREAYANLLYSVKERKGFCVLTGEVGTGKTTLLLRLMEQLGATVRFAFVYNTRLSFDELLSFMCEEFLLSAKDKNRVEKIQSLNEFLIAQLRSRSTAVLLVDEAQNLDAEALENLRLLSNLETADAKLLQIVLVGQPELLRKLDAPGLRQVKQRIAVWIRLARLHEKEVGQFIRHRLQTVGYKKKELFPARAIRQIVLLTRGIPRLINIVCDNALVIAYAGSKKKVSPEIVREVASDLRLGTGVPYEIGEHVGWDWEPEHYAAGETEWNGRPRLASRGRRWLKIGSVSLAGVAFLAAFLFAGTPTLVRTAISDLWDAGGRTLEMTRHVVKTIHENLLLEFGDRQDSIASSEVPPVSAHSRAVVESPPQREPGSANRPASDEPFPRREFGAGGDPRAAGGVIHGFDADPRLENDPATEPHDEWIVQPVVVERSTSIDQLVRTVYGDENTLAMDLAGEYNPHIGDFERLQPGDQLWLPPLSREILLRRRADGSYNFVLASFRSSHAANRFARRVERSGYTVTIRPRKVAGVSSLYRIEIVGLRNLKAAEQAWQLARGHYWLGSEDHLAATQSRPKGR